MENNIYLLFGSTYCKNFILDDVTLKILVEILENFSKKLPTIKGNKKLVSEENGIVKNIENIKELESIKTIFYIENEDNKFIETTELKDILNNPNNANKKIITLGIELCILSLTDNSYKKDRDWIARIVFFKKSDPKVKLSIVSIDPNWSKQLANEIQPQIERTLKTKNISLCYILALFFLISAFFQSILLKFPFYSFFPDPIVSFIKYSPIFLFIIGVMYITNASIKKVSWFTKYFGPESIFLWGDEKSASTNKEQHRKTILISMILAFVVNVIANLYFFILISN